MASFELGKEKEKDVFPHGTIFFLCLILITRQKTSFSITFSKFHSNPVIKTKNNKNLTTIKSLKLKTKSKIFLLENKKFKSKFYNQLLT